MGFKSKSLVSSSGGFSAGDQILDVGDVPDNILEALALARGLQRDHKGEVKEIGKDIESLLRPVLATMAAAAEQLAEVV